MYAQRDDGELGHASSQGADHRPTDGGGEAAANGPRGLVRVQRSKQVSAKLKESFLAAWSKPASGGISGEQLAELAQLLKAAAEMLLAATEAIEQAQSEPEPED